MRRCFLRQDRLKWENRGGGAVLGRKITYLKEDKQASVEEKQASSKGGVETLVLFNSVLPLMCLLELTFAENKLV
jgi:hypothetical protein